MFCVMTAETRPRRSSSASAKCASFGSRLGQSAVAQRVEAPDLLRDRSRNASIVAYSIGSYCAQMPVGERKSGMPLSVETPAPVRTTQLPRRAQQLGERCDAQPTRASSSASGTSSNDSTNRSACERSRPLVTSFGTATQNIPAARAAAIAVRRVLDRDRLVRRRRRARRAPRGRAPGSACSASVSPSAQTIAAQPSRELEPREVPGRPTSASCSRRCRRSSPSARASSR